jgi:hypothetical protein
METLPLFSKLVLSAILLLSLQNVNAQNEIPSFESCSAMAQSMANIAEARRLGMTQKEATEIYDSLVTGKKLTSFSKRIYVKIKEIYGLKPFSIEATLPLIKREFVICTSLKGDYDKLKKG